MLFLMQMLVKQPVDIVLDAVALQRFAVSAFDSMLQRTARRARPEC